MNPLTALGGGLAGACAVTLIHETVRKIVPEAPRLDLLGMTAIEKGLRSAGKKAPGEDQLFTWALAGDIVSNSLYFSLAGVGKEKNLWMKSSLLGLAAGIGAVVLPEPLGLSGRHTNKTVSTKLMTIGLYVAGALVTTAVMKVLEKRSQKRHEVWEERLVTSAMV